MNKAESDLCTCCNEDREAIDHIFWECPDVTSFWKQFQSFIRDKGPNIITNWNKLNILFGNAMFDVPLNLILIKAKQFIYSMKIKKKSLPMFDYFKTSLLHFFNI